MLRQIIQIAIPVILPFLVYGLWLKWARAKAIREGHDVIPPWDKGPWLLLLGIGVALAAAILIVTALGTGASPDSIYHPPVLKDGVVQPGFFEPKE
ncbi:hypothetical protein ABIE64_003263 [Thalassospira sp. MBR-102]|jgi:hypothetical protein|uniref:Uncharacterized protein n=3 Tax=Thalassospira TaxID=168934 RepID=A0ABR5Y4L3_9PROT|nr:MULTISPECIES: hypothetical protein [Thalassospira]MBR9781887.1 hypothetical protein [Rhodospirillales bacterium]AJD50537.1 hypothetical protein TH3_02055 [Thalassospira xiamenensis M-5 = DSM 17429]KEO55846.1 hypothetical protein SMB34_05370 [Thalassospira permensis NBRC 106175]KZD04796.1 hypothetical protein AUP40_14620 [Thalassospira xiamenensis]KZD05573.1 hypothetical protein AUP45_20625 [Thalassospira xiamenensis]|tara:strand:- start:2429 stop:2716 length:288 start_codon:yes stop_codon:yes gene_type:complete